MATDEMLGMWNGETMTWSGTFDGDNFWQLIPSDYEGYFWLVNQHETNENCTFTQWYDGTTRPWCTSYDEDALWEMIPVTVNGDSDHYALHNKYYDFYLQQTASGLNGHEVTAEPSAADLPSYLWRFTPRYEGVVNTETIWEIDNRDGNHNVTKELHGEIGFTGDVSETTYTAPGFYDEVYIEFAEALYRTQDLPQEAMDHYMEEFYNATTEPDHIEKTVNVTAGAGKYFGVYQLTTRMYSPREQDNFVYHGKPHPINWN